MAVRLTLGTDAGTMDAGGGAGVVVWTGVGGELHATVAAITKVRRIGALIRRIGSELLVESPCHASAMRVALAIAVIALGHEARAESDCAHVLERLDQQVAEAIANPINLAATPVDSEGEPCVDTDGSDAEPTVETGTLSGHRATVRRDGPAGSGRYWGIDVRVAIGGHQLGACMQTSTTWWRNLPDDTRKRLAPWHVLGRGTFSVWETLAVGESEWESLALPLVYRVSKQQLVLDRKRTTSAIAQFGRVYRDAATIADDGARAMHLSAAAAYAAFATHGKCK
jgi:hypothetical protein